MHIDRLITFRCVNDSRTATSDMLNDVSSSASDISDMMSRTSLEDHEQSQQPPLQEQSQHPQLQQRRRRLQNERQHHRLQQQYQSFRVQGPRNPRKKHHYTPSDPARLALDDLRTLDYRMVPNEDYFFDERGRRRIIPKFPSSALDSDPVTRTRRELQMEWQRRVLEALAGR